MRDTEKRRSKVSRHFRRSMVVDAAAFTASSIVSTTKPSTPCVITSGTEPWRYAMTGVPHARDSIITSPNGSGQSMGKIRAPALPRNSLFSPSPISPTYSIKW
jgi:hypothetical protein